MFNRQKKYMFFYVYETDTANGTGSMFSTVIKGKVTEKVLEEVSYFIKTNDPKIKTVVFTGFERMYG